MITSYHWPPGHWLVISPHRLSQCDTVSHSVTLKHNKHKTVTTGCVPPPAALSTCCWNVPEAVRPWGGLLALSALSVFKDTREAPGLGTVSVVLTSLSCSALTAGQQGHYGRHERPASTRKVWAQTEKYCNLLYPDILWFWHVNQKNWTNTEICIKCDKRKEFPSYKA